MRGVKKRQPAFPLWYGWPDLRTGKIQSDSLEAQMIVASDKSKNEKGESK